MSSRYRFSRPQNKFSGVVSVSPSLSPILPYDNELRGFSQCFHALQQSTPEINWPSQLLTEILLELFITHRLCSVYLTSNLESCFWLSPSSPPASTKGLRSSTTGQSEK
jgi:hypothetical protein